MSQNRWFRFAIAMAALDAACADLRDLEVTNTCGNEIVEPENDEDCDTHGVGGKTRCGAPSGASACRFVCERDEDGALSPCPLGWSCGVDSVCRFPMGRFEDRRRVPLPIDDPSLLGIADIDGDGRKDVVAQTGPSLILRFGDPSGAFEEVYQTHIEVGTGNVELGDLDRDGQDDIVVPHRAGLSVLRGQRNRSLMPALYPSRSPPEPLTSDTRLFSAVAIPGLGLRQAIRIDRVSVGHALALAFENQRPPPSTWLVLPTRFESAPVIGVGNIDTGSSLEPDAIAIGLKDTREVHILGIQCTIDNSGSFLCGLEPRATVTMPLLTEVNEGALFADVDGDGRMDLVVMVAAGTGPQREGGRVAVAFQTPSGAFGDADGQPNQASRDARFDILDIQKDPAIDAPWMLAAGDLTGDGRADFVTPWAILASNSTMAAPLIVVSINPSNEPWTEAVIGDFNGDGHDDVAMTPRGRRQIDFMLGTGTPVFNFRTEITMGLPSKLTSGDFDGDGKTDLAFVEDASQIMLRYQGTQAATPIAHFGEDMVEHIIAVDSTAVGLRDRTTDLEVLTQKTLQAGETTMTPNLDRHLLVGSTSRRMSAPLQVRSQDSAYAPVPLRAHIGDFAGLKRNPDILVPAGVTGPGAGSSGVGGDPIPVEGSIAVRPWLIEGQASALGQEALQIDQFEGCGFSGLDLRCARGISGRLVPSSLKESLFLIDDPACRLGSSVVLQVSLDSSAAKPTLTCQTRKHDFNFRKVHGLTLADVNTDGTQDLVLTFAAQPKGTSYVRAENAINNGALTPEMVESSDASVAVFLGRPHGLDESPSAVPGLPSLGALTEPRAVAPIVIDPRAPISFVVLAKISRGVETSGPSEGDGDVPSRITRERLFVSGPSQSPGQAEWLEASDDVEPHDEPVALYALDANADGLEDVVVADRNSMVVYLQAPCSARAAYRRECPRPPVQADTGD